MERLRELCVVGGFTRDGYMAARASKAVDDVNKAVLMGRLLIDWQLETPIYQDANEAEAQTLGEGPMSSTGKECSPHSVYPIG